MIVLSSTDKTMEPAALGLTCKDAFHTLIEHETLRLQQENKELKARLIKYEPIHKPLRVFKSWGAYFDVKEQVEEYLYDWICNNVTSCMTQDFDSEGINAMCDVHAFEQAIAKSVLILTNCKKYSAGVAERAFSHVTAVCKGIYELDHTWCEDKRLVLTIIDQSLDDYIFNEINSDLIVVLNGDSDFYLDSLERTPIDDFFNPDDPDDVKCLEDLDQLERLEE